DPGAEREARDPAMRRRGVLALQPIERCRRIGKLTLAAVVGALGAADAAEVEAQRGKAAPREQVIELVDDLVVHRPAVLRMRVQQQGDGRIRSLAMVIAAFEPSFGPGDNYVRHVSGPNRRELFGNSEAWYPASKRGRRPVA